MQNTLSILASLILELLDLRHNKESAVCLKIKFHIKRITCLDLVRLKHVLACL